MTKFINVLGTTNFVIVNCYVASCCMLSGFRLKDSQQLLDEHSKFNEFCNRRLRHHYSCLYTYLLTSTALIQCYLQYIHIMVVLPVLYMID